MPTFDVNDTIVAIASPPGASQRGILRISGPDMAKIVDTVFAAASRRTVGKLSAVDALPGQLDLGDNLSLPGNLLAWPTSRSYTRQPSAEFHTFGSSPLLKSALAKFCDAGARIAEPGEFTLRAFLSGRIDLTQAEAVLAVIDANGQHDLRSSLQQLAGGMANPLTSARDLLIAVLAELEAQLDFVDEDIEFISSPQLLSKLNDALSELQTTTRQLQQRSITGQCPTVVLIGPPNAGKSSLFNSLIGKQQAIVTNIAGTTTDYVSAEVNFAGSDLRLIDTAGFEDAAQAESISDSVSNSISADAQQQRVDQTIQSDIRLLCVAGDQIPDQNVLQLLAEAIQPKGSNERQQSTLLVITKSDRPQNEAIAALVPETSSGNLARYTTSSETGAGLDWLKESIARTATNMQNEESPIVGSTLIRTADSLRLAEQSVKLAIEAASENLGEELVAAEIRQALDQLGRVVGTIYTDDILDVIFGQFCIGK